MQKYPYTYQMTDQQVVETLAKWGSNAPDLERVPPSQWNRCLVMFTLVEMAVEDIKAGRISEHTAVIGLKLNPLFQAASYATGNTHSLYMVA